MSPGKDAGPLPGLKPQMRRDECAELLKLMSGVSRPLEDVVADFLARVPPERRLRFGSTIKFVLEENLIFRPAERLIAFAILHQSYSSPLTNPFVPLLTNAACDEVSDRSERVFLQLLLTSANGNNNIEILKQSAQDYLKEPSYASQALLPRDQLERQYSCNDVQRCKAATVQRSISDPDVSQSCGDSLGDNEVMDLIQQTQLKAMSAPWVRPSPPRLEILEGEFQWLNLDNNHELLWDSSMCVDTSSSMRVDTSQGASIQDLVGKACKGPLAPAQQEQVVLDLARDSKLVHHCGMTPAKLSKLVEHNPLIAVEVLSKLIDCPDIDYYFDALVEMKISLHSVEVLIGLAKVVHDLPKEFLNAYLTKCFLLLENSKDKHLHKRLASLVEVVANRNQQDELSKKKKKKETNKMIPTSGEFRLERIIVQSYAA